MKEPFVVGYYYPLTLTGLALGGEALGRKENFVFFVPYGVPGDEVEVEITTLKKNYARGRILKIIKPSPSRIEPRCPIFYRCGGCQLQQMTYEAQLLYKRQMVQDALEHIGKVKDVQTHACLGAKEPWLYRNKVQVVAAAKPFLPSTSLRIYPYLGLYAKDTHHVVKMEHCAIQHPLNNMVLQAISEILGKLQWEVYDERTGKGLLRHIVSRVSTAQERILLTLVTTDPNLPQVQEFVNIMQQKVPNLAGILLNINPHHTNVILGAKTRVLWGLDHVIEEVNGLKFRISAGSFFQVNPMQLPTLYRILEEYADLRANENVLDAYCGVGTLAVYLARKAKRVYGVEENEEAVQDGMSNAELNDLKNIDFIAGHVERILPDLMRREIRFDMAVLDPPRKGCSEQVLDNLAQLRIKRIVYVSCNPATLARDLGYLAERGYRVPEVQSLDMFPQTAHVECLAKVVKG